MTDCFFKVLSMVWRSHVTKLYLENSKLGLRVNRKAHRIQLRQSILILAVVSRRLRI